MKAAKILLRLMVLAGSLIVLSIPRPFVAQVGGCGIYAPTGGATPCNVCPDAYQSYQSVCPKGPYILEDVVYCECCESDGEPCGTYWYVPQPVYDPSACCIADGQSCSGGSSGCGTGGKAVAAAFATAPRVARPHVAHATQAVRRASITAIAAAVIAITAALKVHARASAIRTEVHAVPRRTVAAVCALAVSVSPARDRTRAAAPRYRAVAACCATRSPIVLLNVKHVSPTATRAPRTLNAAPVAAREELAPPPAWQMAASAQVAPSAVAVAATTGAASPARRQDVVATTAGSVAAVVAMVLPGTAFSCG